jgi:hypothetical protein
VKREASLSSYYCGYDIEGNPVQAPRGIFSWALEVLRDSQSIFILEIGIPWDDLSAKGLERDQAIAYVGQEGLHRVTGRLSLGWFKAEERYRHTIIAKGDERVEPPPTEVDFLTFASDEERAEYWLLRALYHIRAEYPGLYRDVQFDWRGVCIVTHTPVKTGRLALDLLSERELISKLHYVKGTTKNSWELVSGSISITASGVEHYRDLEQTIKEQMKESEIMNALEIQRRIFEAISDIQQEPNQYVGDSRIAERLKLDLQEVQDHLDLMEDAGFVELAKTFGGYSAYPTSSGRVYLRDPAYVQQTSSSQATPTASGDEWDVFVCHASEDKEGFVRPLAKQLEECGLRVWFDEFTLTVGDSLNRSINHGLAHSKYGVVVISRHFLEKEWPQKELDGLVAREVDGQKVILPIWHNITADKVRQHSPILADRVAALSKDGLDRVVEQLLEAMGVG